jgi:formate dehydrogenase gamma subunit
MKNREPVRFKRFSLSQRIEHVLVIVSFTVLSITGLPQEYAHHGWAQTMMRWMGGIENVRWIHHAAAVLLILEAVLHVILVGYRIYVRGDRVIDILPGLKDVRDVFDTLRYNLGLQDRPPLFGRYSFGEKLEYWAVIWGSLIMILTGFVMWNPIATTTFLPGEVVPVSLAAHGGEALLAVLSIVIWHMYNVHVRHLNKSMFTGWLSREEMLDEHPLELARIEAGEERRLPEPVRERRRRRYMPIAGVVTAVSLILVYAFVTLETTAIETVLPPPDVVVFEPAIPRVPVGDPTAVTEVQAAFIPHPLTDRENCLRCHALGTIRPFPADHVGRGNELCLNCHQPVGGTTNSEPLPGEDVPSFRTEIEPALEENCVVCHGVAGGLNLSGYSWLIAGGEDGPAVVAGQPDASLIVEVLEAGHFAELPSEALDALSQWIAAGAPNN